MILGFLAKYYDVVAIVAITLSIGAYVFHQGYNTRIQVEQSVIAKQEKVKNEIRNQPHSIAIATRRMQRGTF